MRRTRRQLLVLLLLACAGFASLATEEAPPSLNQNAGDRLTFNGSQRTEVRHVSIALVAGDEVTGVSVDVPIHTGGVNGQVPVVLSVTRDPDVTPVNVEDVPWWGMEAGDTDNDAGGFVAIDSCFAGQTCTESYTFTFLRIFDDPRPSLAFDWSVDALAEYSELPVGASPPAGASLTVTISH